MNYSLNSLKGVYIGDHIRELAALHLPCPSPQALCDIPGSSYRFRD